MKFLKGIGLFVIYPVVMLGLGFFSGIWAYRFFYPGYSNNTAELRDIAQKEYVIQNDSDGNGSAGQAVLQPYSEEAGAEKLSDGELLYEAEEESVAAANVSDTLTADTEYVLEETDLLRNTVVETVQSLPHKYIGMDREQFLASIEDYGESPTLSEQEKGFVGLEVLSFSKDRVVVQMNYKYIPPDEGFYLAVYDNEVIVYLEDRETVYFNTGIRMDMLPENIQAQIIQMMWIPDEESLFGFLEAYSS